MNELLTRASANASASAATDNQLVSWDDKHCLIIDDIAGIRRLLRESLRNLGVKHVDQASTGSEAIAMIARQRYDIVLCDYNLDEGKNGQQVLEEARSRNYLLPSSMFIIISAEKTIQSVMGAAEHQPDAYLIKPITEGTLLTRLNRIWHQKQVFRQIDQAFANKDYHGAAALCDQQILVDRVHETELLRMKAQMLVKNGENEQAREVYERILQGHDYDWAKVGVAKIRLQQGEHEAARQIFQDVLTENRYFIDAYDQLALAYQQLGQADEACNVLERASKLSPNSVTRQKSLGEVALKLGKMELAEKAFRKCISVGEHSVNRTPDPYFGLARLCGLRNEPKEAMLLLATVQKDFAAESTDLRATITKGLVCYESGDHRAARVIGDELETMLASNQERPDTPTCLEMASLLFAVGVRDAPVELLCYVIKNNDDDKAVFADVQKVFDKASMADEGSVLIMASRKEAADMMNQGVLLWKTGKLDEAVAWMRAARETLPHNLRVLFNSAQIIISYLQQRGADSALVAEATEVLLHVEKLSPGHPRFAELMTQLARFAPEMAGAGAREE
ncbi:MAG: response regulator [Pseudomonadota bacterium]